MDSRIAKRRREVRRERMRRRRRRFATAAVLVLIAGVGVWAVNSPLLALAEVRVKGTGQPRSVQVRQAAGLALGTSTVQLPLNAARERVEGLPWVKDAVIRRPSPLTVTIEVDERRPRLVLTTRQGAALVDDEGIVVRTRRRSRRPELPVIETGLDRPPAAGDSVNRIPAVANAHAVFRKLPPGLRAKVTRYRAHDADDVTLVLEGGMRGAGEAAAGEIRPGTRVRFGRADRVAAKTRVLRALLDRVSEDPPSGPPRVVDVRVPTNPVLVPAGTRERG